MIAEAGRTKASDAETLAEWALTLKTLGGLALSVAGVWVLWVWTGLRAGSWLWFYLSGATGLAGLVLVAAGVVAESRIGPEGPRLEAEEPRVRDAA